VKHAQGAGISLRLSYESEQVKLCVDDRGPGLREGADATGGAGFRTMRQRAELIGANFQLTRGADGQGVTVTCLLPLRKSR
jgi:signal transduction histidine kinase